MSRRFPRDTLAAALALAERHGEAALAAELRTLLPRPRGRPKGRAGNGERNEWYADVWGEINDAIVGGIPEENALAAAQKRTAISESVLLDIWNQRRPRVNEILRRRGLLN